MSPPESNAARFWKRVHKGPGCWLWTAGRTEPYGKFTWWTDGVPVIVGAHRAAWTLTNGPIPDGLLVCHHCDNPPCVRPDHLFLGTVADNNRDMHAKGRHGHGRGLPGGEAHPRATLTWSAVDAMRDQYRKGATVRELSEAFGTYPTNVHKIVRGQAWRRTA